MPSETSVPPWMDEIPPLQDTHPVDAAEAQKKTESSDGIATEVAGAPVQEARPARAALPVPALNWDGNWPALAAQLPLRGVVQQLAQQSELLDCEDHGAAFTFVLRIPLDTLRSAGSVDKLAAALAEHFGKDVRVNTEIGAVRNTANAAAIAEREARQREAEERMRNDPFVQALMRDFGATVVPGSIRPV